MRPHIIFRLKTALTVVGVDEPVVVSPQIREPIKWSDIELVGEVDPEYHGFNYDYSDGSLKLDFTCENAHTLLSDQYYRYGNDAEVEFQVVAIAADGTELVEYFGKIDFNDIVIQPGRVSAPIVRKDLHDRIQSRWDTPVALDTTKALDDTPVAPPSVSELPIPGQTIREKAESNMKQLFDKYETFQAPATDIGLTNSGIDKILLPNMLKGKDDVVSVTNWDKIEGCRDLPGGTVVTGPEEFPVIVVDERNPGTYALEIDWNCRFDLSLTKKNFQPGKVRIDFWLIEPFLRVDVPGESSQHIRLAPPQAGGGEATSTGFRHFDCHYRGSLNLPAGSRAMVYFVIRMRSKAVKQLAIGYIQNLFRISVDRRTRAEASRSNAVLLVDALRHTLGVVAGKEGIEAATGRMTGSLISRASAEQPFDGAATEYALSTGAWLRGLDKAPTFSLKDLMGVLRSHHWAGLLYETDENNQVHSVRVEEGDWFYRGGEIIRVEEVFEYKEEPDDEIIFNKIEVGYEKFPEEGTGVAEEFNTVRTYQTPIITRESTLDIKCSMIGAGTAIEEARRLGIETTDANGVKSSTKSDAGRYDDDGFLLHVAPQSLTDTVTFSVTPAGPLPAKPYAVKTFKFGSTILDKPFISTLKPGDRITFTGTGTANDGIAYRITAVRRSGLTNLIRPSFEVDPVQPMVAAGPVTAQFSLPAQGIKLRTNERLDVEGITDPANTYNLELTPARMLLRWAPLINSGLRYKKTTDELRCMFVKQNGQVVTHVKSGANPLPGDPDKQVVRENGNIPLGAFQRFRKIFSPERITVKARVPRQDIRALFDALKNKGPEAKRMGFVAVKNPAGEYVAGFVRQVRYNPCTDVVEFILRKKFVLQGDPGPQCIDYADWAFGRFETDTTAKPELYRFCRFLDFL